MNIQSLTIGEPKGPFPVLQFDVPNNKRGMIVGYGETVDVARYAMQAGAAQFLARQKSKAGKPPRTVRYLDPNHAALFYSDGKLAAVLAVEVVPVPQGASHPGDILIDAPGVK